LNKGEREGDSGWEGERGGEADDKGRQERIGDERGGVLPPPEWRSGYTPAEKQVQLSRAAVAARGSVAPGANLRPAAPPCQRSQPTRDVGSSPARVYGTVGRSPDRR